MKSAQSTYRHEYKYLITEPTMAILQERIRNLIPRDPHSDIHGKYTIRSLYFDDMYNTCYYDNEDGIEPREKYRIRIYNASDKRISLECKRKYHGMTHKTSARIDRFQAQQLISHIPLSLTQVQDETLVKFLLLSSQKEMTPSIIVEYQRSAYIYPTGNVRVTFDTNIVSSSDFNNFFKPSISCRPILTPGYHLMEIKYDHFLPDFIFQSLQLDCLQQTTFSKFYLCRKYSI